MSAPNGASYSSTRSLFVSATHRSPNRSSIKPAGAHKSIAQGLYGYFTAGCLFGLAFVVGGHSLWLPITMHATAILVIEVMRLYTVHQAPPWLAGFSELPQSGVVGTVVVVGMAIALVALI